MAFRGVSHTEKFLYQRSRMSSGRHHKKYQIFIKKKSNYSDWSMEKQTYLGKLIPNPIQKPYRNWVFLGGEIIVGMQIILSISQMIQGFVLSYNILTETLIEKTVLNYFKEIWDILPPHPPKKLELDIEKALLTNLRTVLLSIIIN